MQEAEYADERWEIARLSSENVEGGIRRREWSRSKAKVG